MPPQDVCSRTISTLKLLRCVPKHADTHLSYCYYFDDETCHRFFFFLFSLSRRVMSVGARIKFCSRLPRRTIAQRLTRANSRIQMTADLL